MAPQQQSDVTTLAHRIVRLKPQQASDLDGIGLAEFAPEANVEDYLSRLLPQEGIPANRPIVLLWKGDELASPDKISVLSAVKREDRIELEVDVRRFSGPVHANVVTVPIVEVALGPETQGLKSVTVAVSEHSFSDRERPEDAEQSSTKQLVYDFRVV